MQYGFSWFGLTQEAGQADGLSPGLSQPWIRLGHGTEALHDQDSKLGPLSRGPLSCLSCLVPAPSQTR